MGGFDFEWKGKIYTIPTEGGYPFFETDEEETAFEQWRVTPAGIQLFGPVPKDWSEEHYLDDRYPWDSERGCRVDVEDVGKEKKNIRSSSSGCDSEEDEDSYYDEPNIDWCSYEKCRFNCYRHFYVTRNTYECAMCGVMSCKECARGSFKKCSGDGCNLWVCGCDCDCCDYCEEQKKEKKKNSKRGKKKKTSH